jgi:hypothetical protein
MTNENAPVPEIRVSHVDRDRVAEQLRVAAGDGRLTMEELDERLEQALNARTGSDLAVLTTDLPATAGAAGPPAPAAAKALARIEVSSGSTVREGRWAVPRALDVKIGSGSVRLDLTHAVVTEPLLRIAAEVRSGSLTIVTRPGVEVVVDEVSVSSGSAKVRRAENEHLVPAELRIEVSGTVKSGSILARPPRRSFLNWLLRRPR